MVGGAGVSRVPFVSKTETDCLPKGAFLGHKVGKKSDHAGLGAVGGALAGAVVANMASNAVKGHHHHGSAHDRRRDRLERRLDRLG